MTSCASGFFNLGDFIPTTNTECVIQTDALRALWIIALIVHSLAIFKYLLLGKQLHTKFKVLRGELLSSTSSKNDNNKVFNPLKNKVTFKVTAIEFNFIG